MRGQLLLIASLVTVGLTDQREIPVPPIATRLGTLPGVDRLPARPALPDVLLMDDGTRVTTPRQWQARRQEMRRILSYYAVGQMPPPPGNVKGREIRSELVLDGSAWAPSWMLAAFGRPHPRVTWGATLTGARI